MSLDRYHRFLCLYCNHCSCSTDLSSYSEQMDHRETMEAARALGWLWLGLDVHLCPRCASHSYNRQVYELEVLQLRRLASDPVAAQFSDDGRRPVGLG